ncbi:uncharacterized protein SCHCODRAFT_01257052 [Schizophyllum commune H4-8]|uniref:uncharacterized protein n=1 Tax=Schizophyllum commune (strain H4-8 / FGSC 9210) TaxID=578458 RepID=UPI00215E9051|nr:uncharacterized protein SCHCODRAFT_01257052 [Schizophyllum commune H4-8]KAI5885499.1 hypothetical protein SCHCODRAFT_01257052 [Schizophyllum commune H4-8]
MLRHVHTLQAVCTKRIKQTTDDRVPDRRSVPMIVTTHPIIIGHRVATIPTFLKTLTTTICCNIGCNKPLRLQVHYKPIGNSRAPSPPSSASADPSVAVVARPRDPDARAPDAAASRGPPPASRSSHALPGRCPRRRCSSATPLDARCVARRCATVRARRQSVPVTVPRARRSLATNARSLATLAHRCSAVVASTAPPRDAHRSALRRRRGASASEPGTHRNGAGARSRLLPGRDRVSAVAAHRQLPTSSTRQRHASLVSSTGCASRSVRDNARHARRGSAAPTARASKMATRP